MRAIKKTIFTFLSLINVVYCYTQQHSCIDSLPAKTVYQQKFNDYNELKLNVYENDMYYIWETFIQSGLKIVLGRDSLKKDSAETSDFMENNLSSYLSIIGCTHSIGHNVYVVYNKQGYIYLANYNHQILNKIDCKKKELLFFPAMGLSEPLTANFQQIDGTVICILASGKNCDDNFRALYSIDPESFDVKEIVFNKKTKIVTGFCLEQGSNERLIDLENYDELTSDEEKELKWLKKYINKPYHFKKLSLNKKKRDKEIAAIRAKGFELYQFEKYLSNYVYKILDFGILDDDKNKIEILRSVNDDYNNYYFFYKSNKDKRMGFIRYYSDDFYWLISDYKKVEVK